MASDVAPILQCQIVPSNLHNYCYRHLIPPWPLQQVEVQKQDSVCAYCHFNVSLVLMLVYSCIDMEHGGGC